MSDSLAVNPTASPAVPAPRVGPASVPPPQRILFVDDEVQILEALQNSFRKQRRVWDMVFAVGGVAALAELEKAPFDVVVSDMRMPGLDGAALLAKVRDHYPSVARIVLSGHADQDAVVRALPVAHQFLSKPCDGDHLRLVIERTCNLQRLLRDETIRRTAGRLDRLPSAADSYWELTRALGDPHTNAGAIAAIVEQDPAMAAKILQLVNSAYFGLARRVTSIVDAVKYLGTDLIKGLALTAQVFSVADGGATKGLPVQRLQAHSLITARLAKRLVGRQDVAEEAFVAGLLHDVGQLVLALGTSDYNAIVRTAEEAGRPLHDVEYEVLGVSHAEVGAYLIGVWGLPFPVVEAVAYHHRPGLVAEGDRDVLAAVHVADAILEGEKHGAAIDAAFLETGPWKAELPRWRTLAAGMVADANDLRASRD